MAGGGLAARIPGLIEQWRGICGSAPGIQGALSGREIEKAGAALLVLQRGLTAERPLAGARYMEDASLLGAYLLYYWPVSYMQVSIALAGSGLNPRRVLDLGSGSGPCSAAILDALEPSQTLERIVLVDASKKALELGTALLGHGDRRPKHVEGIELDLESGRSLPEGPFDLVVFGHCLNELWARGSQAESMRPLDLKLRLVEHAAERLDPEGRLLLLEPALLGTSRDLIELRDALVARGWLVNGPCTGSFPCPAFLAGPKRSCHAESPWNPPEPIASLARAAGLDRSSAKLAYFILSRPTTAGMRLSRRPGADAQDERRIVSDPMLNKAGRLRYLLCGDGRLEAVSARSDDASAHAAGFGDLRRGDVLRLRGLERRPGGGLGVCPKTEIDLVSLAPEASP
jgi:SAM-dependent methyltransferase